MHRDTKTTSLLHGIRVLDLTRVLAGPLCTMTLGDMGADVIKVERPRTGDETRGWGPPFDPEGQSAYFLAVNRNKLSLILDVDDPADRTLLVDLMAEADVVVDNFRPGSLEGRGIDPDGLLTSHPRLIWCTITGFGRNSDRPGYDYVVQAEAGWMAITGEPGGSPMKVGVALADVIAGKDATSAILGALVARAGTTPLDHRARRIHISLLDSAVAALVNVAQNVLVSGHDSGRWGNAHANLVPYELFRASDRDVVIAVGSDQQWQGCCRALGLSGLASDATLASNAGRLADRSRVVSAVATAVSKLTAAECTERLSRYQVPNGVIRLVQEVIGGTSASPLTGLPPAVPGRVRFRPPHLGEHGPLVRSQGWKAFMELQPSAVADG